MQKEHVPFLRQYVIFAHSPNKFSIFRTAQIINMTASGHSTRFLTATQKSDHITQYWKPFIGFQYNIELLFKSFCYLTNLSPVHALLIWCRSCNYSQSDLSLRLLSLLGSCSLEQVACWSEINYNCAHIQNPLYLPGLTLSRCCCFVYAVFTAIKPHKPAQVWLCLLFFSKWFI